MGDDPVYVAHPLKRAIEKKQLLDPKRIEHSVEIIQKDARENWQKIVEEISDLGNRLQEAAQTAWISNFMRC